MGNSCHIYGLCSFAKQGDNTLGSICPFVCLPVLPWMNNSHYQSKVFVCVFVIRGHIKVRMQSIDFLIKAVVIIYGRGGRGNYENRSHSKCAPPR